MVKEKEERGGEGRRRGWMQQSKNINKPICPMYRPSHELRHKTLLLRLHFSFSGSENSAPHSSGDGYTGEETANNLQMHGLEENT